MHQIEWTNYISTEKVGGVFDDMTHLFYCFIVDMTIQPFKQ